MISLYGLFRLPDSACIGVNLSNPYCLAGSFVRQMLYLWIKIVIVSSRLPPHPVEKVITMVSCFLKASCT